MAFYLKNTLGRWPKNGRIIAISEVLPKVWGGANPTLGSLVQGSGPRKNPNSAWLLRANSDIGNRDTSLKDDTQNLTHSKTEGRQFFKEEMQIDDHQAYENKVSIANYQGNANQNHNQISPHNCQNGYNQKEHK